MYEMKFHLTQVAIYLKKWITGLYEGDDFEKAEFTYHLNILLNLLAQAEPKMKEAKRQIAEKKELERQLRAEERERIKKELKDAKNRLDSKAEDDSLQAC